MSTLQKYLCEHGFLNERRANQSFKSVSPNALMINDTEYTVQQMIYVVEKKIEMLYGRDIAMKLRLLMDDVNSRVVYTNMNKGEQSISINALNFTDSNLSVLNRDFSAILAAIYMAKVKKYKYICFTPYDFSVACDFYMSNGKEDRIYNNVAVSVNKKTTKKRNKITPEQVKIYIDGGNLGETNLMNLLQLFKIYDTAHIQGYMQARGILTNGQNIAADLNNSSIIKKEIADIKSTFASFHCFVTINSKNVAFSHSLQDNIDLVFKTRKNGNVYLDIIC